MPTNHSRYTVLIFANQSLLSITIEILHASGRILYDYRQLGNLSSYFIRNVINQPNICYSIVYICLQNTDISGISYEN